MEKETMILIAAVLSSIITLCGVVVAWILNNISSAEKMRMEERSSYKRALEEKYQKILFSIELFLRSKNSGKELNKELSELNSMVALFGGAEVVSAFNVFAEKYDEYEKLASKCTKQLIYISDASKDFPAAWNALVQQKELITMTMREQIKNLNNFEY